MQFVLAIAVILAAPITMFVVGRMRQARLRKKVRLEITNAGNVRSRYDLRAQSADQALQFQFTLEGDNLPVFGGPSPVSGVEPPDVKGDRKRLSGGTLQGGWAKAGKAIQVGSAVAGILSMIGSLLPRSIGGPIQQRASQLRNVQMRASYVQQAPERVAFQASSVAHTITGKGGTTNRPGRVIHPEELERQAALASPAPVADGFIWAQTPYVEPGDRLSIELLIRPSRPAGAQAHAFQVISRAADREAAPAVKAEGSVQLRGGFWTRRFLPYVLVGLLTVVLAVALVFLGYWLVAAGVLA